MSGSGRRERRRVAAIVDELWDLEPAEREARLRELCPDDAATRAEVRRWLSAKREAGPDPLGRPLAEVAPDVLAELAGDPEGAGRRFGPWRTVRELGRGGTGIVWLAERADGAYDARVALKLLWGRARSAELERRFETERRILATLEHPHIARLIDGGVTEDGTPYLVMERVEGAPIDEWCDRRGASLEERLALFEKVCEAVAYAHRNLVVHRDLKPSNVLVTDEGEPKVVDFGIAKPLDEEGPSRTIVPILTPAYAAPEHIRGGSTTTGTDVWGLGAILFRLVAGRDGRSVESASPGELAEAARRPLPLPSAVADVERTGIPRRRIAGDVDAIVAAATRIDPEARYATAGELAADVRRFLEGRPIEARRPGGLYRLRKFVARNRAAVATVATIATLVVATAVTASVQAGRIAAERDRAEREAARARQATEFLTGLFDQANPRTARGEALTAEALLDRGVARVDSVLGDQPDVHGEMLTTLGFTVFRRGRIREAIGLLERAVEVLRPIHDGTEVGLGYALTILGSARHAIGEYEGAERAYREAVAVQRVADPRGEYHSRAVNALGWILWDLQRLDEALEVYAEAEAIRREALGTDHPAYATTLENTGLVLADQGRPDLAEPLIRRAIDIRRRRYGPQEHTVAHGLRTLGWIRFRRGDVETAERLLRTSAEMYRRLVPPDHPNLVENRTELAALLARRGAFEEAEALLRDALERHRRLGGDHYAWVGLSLHELARIRHADGRADEARRLYGEALEALDASRGPEHPWTLAARGDLARLEVGRDPSFLWLAGRRLPVSADLAEAPTTP